MMSNTILKVPGQENSFECLIYSPLDMANEYGWVKLIGFNSKSIILNVSNQSSYRLIRIFSHEKKNEQCKK